MKRKADVLYIDLKSPGDGGNFSRGIIDGGGEIDSGSYVSLCPEWLVKITGRITGRLFVEPDLNGNVEIAPRFRSDDTVCPYSLFYRSAVIRGRYYYAPIIQRCLLEWPDARCFRVWMEKVKS